MKEWKVDLSKVTVKEYRSLFETGQQDEAGDAILGKAVGLSADEISELSYPEYRLLIKAFFAKAREPLADPS